MNARTERRMKILLADDGSTHAQAAVQLLQELPLSPKSRVNVLRVFPPGQTFAVGQMERGLKHTEEQLLKVGDSMPRPIWCLAIRLKRLSRRPNR
jgi:FtsP/CotA-like multicopper oxidase with cupredoxin domain